MVDSTTNTAERVTVKQLMESLKQFPEDAPVEIAIWQGNKKYPVAYSYPRESAHCTESMFATMRNGIDVRIDVSLPMDNESFMYTGIKKLY